MAEPERSREVEADRTREAEAQRTRETEMAVRAQQEAQLRKAVEEEQRRLQGDVRDLRDLVESLRRFEAKVLIAATILAAIGAWIVVTVRDVDKATNLLQREVTVLQENVRIVREDIQRIRDATDTTKNTVIRLETILDRQTPSASKTPR